MKLNNALKTNTHKGWSMVCILAKQTRKSGIL